MFTFGIIKFMKRKEYLRLLRPLIRRIKNIFIYRNILNNLI